MNKIGILTYSSVYNFGANLQTLSTYLYFKNKGYIVKVIDWCPTKLLEKYSDVPSNQIGTHNHFFSLFKRTQCFSSSKDILNIIKKEGFDAIVIGSDAVIQYMPLLWRLFPSKQKFLRYFNTSEDNYLSCPFLGGFKRDINKSIKLIYLSVSAQSCNWYYLNTFEKNVLRKFFSSFDYISVRDTWTQQLFNKLLPKLDIPQITPDPVFFLNENLLSNKLQLPKQRLSLKSKYILLTILNNNCFVDKNWLEKLKSIANRHNIMCYTLPVSSGKVLRFDDNSFNIDLPLDPLEWYSLIKNSLGYIGFNMHPLICCMHNAVPFYIFDHYVQKTLFTRRPRQYSSKIFDLLNRFDMLDYYNNINLKHFVSPEEVLNKILDFNIDKCKQISNFMKLDYLDNMLAIEQSLK